MSERDRRERLSGVGEFLSHTSAGKISGSAVYYCREPSGQAWTEGGSARL